MRQNQRLTNGANISTIGNLLVNIGILFLTVKIVEISRSNARHTEKTNQLLAEINQKIKES